MKSYIKDDLEWLEAKLDSIKKYIDDNPISTMKDRIISIETGRGAKEQVAATVEQQIKSIKEVLKDLPALLEALDKLRAKNDAAELKLKGDDEMPAIMKGKFQRQS